MNRHTKALWAVLDLHKPGGGSNGCTCGAGSYPCPTVEAISEALVGP